MTGYERFSKLAVDKIIPLIKRIDHEEFAQYAMDSISGISSRQKNLT
jgi:hypothetical protein